MWVKSDRGVRQSTRSRFKIAIFGSANLTGSTSYQQSIEALGRALAEYDYEVLIGSTSGLIGQFIAGINRGANEGVKNCDLHLVAYGDLRYITPEVVDQFTVKPCYFTRLAVLTQCDLFIVLDGQLGTMTETLVAWNQLQATMNFSCKIIVYGVTEQKKLQALLADLVFSKEQYRQLLYFADSVEAVLSMVANVLISPSQH